MHLFKSLAIILSIMMTLLAPSPSSASDEAMRNALQPLLNDDLIRELAVGSLEDVKILVGKGADTNAKTEQDIPALAVAVEREQRLAYPMVKYLIEHGADVNVELPDGSTILMLAIEREEVKSVWHLLKEGAEFRKAGPHGMTPLQLAERTGNGDIIALIKQAHAITKDRYQTERSDHNRNKMLHRYAYYSCSLQYLRYLVASDMMDPKEHPALSDEAIVKRAKQLDRYRREIIQLFNINPKRLELIREKSMEAIAEELNKMVSNQERRIRKVGTQADLKKRCASVASHWEGFKAVDDF